jgi:23S rRNA pseudouridine1911/1915/1917 synthase
MAAHRHILDIIAYSMVAANYNPGPEPGSLPPSVVVDIPASCAGLRLDQALARLLPEHSRSRIRTWIDAGRVSLAGTAIEATRRLDGGERLVVLPLSDPRAAAFAPQSIPLSIVFEDDAIIVIDKQAGLVVHPGSGNWDGTLANALLHHAPELAAIPRAGIVHRLDKDTSGLLVVAKSPIAQTALVRQLQARSVHREYLALAIGDIARGGTVDAPIGRHPARRTSMAVVATGKPAVTRYEVRERLGDCTLLACRLETGRTHQIRVHLASLGHPLVGDAAYGRAHGRAIAFPRQALHAWKLGLVHPLTNASMRWEAPLPDDFATLLANLRQRRPALHV